MIADPLMIEFGCELTPCFIGGLQTEYVNVQRSRLASDKGIILPILRIRDLASLPDKTFRIVSYDKVLWEEEMKEVIIHAFRKNGEIRNLIGIVEEAERGMGNEI